MHRRARVHAVAFRLSSDRARGARRGFGRTDARLAVPRSWGASGQLRLETVAGLTLRDRVVGVADIHLSPAIAPARALP